jgi:hypothetical protein
MPVSAQTRSATASKAEVQALQEQMQAMAERMNRLEAANQTLQAENGELKALVDQRDAETDYLKSQTRELREESAVHSAEIGKVKGADWASKIKFKGDLRYRHEGIETERVVGTGATATVEDAADRTRHRVRARFGFDGTITDNVKATMQIATGGDDPRSSNQTLGSSGTRKSIGLDLGYIDWRITNGVNLLLGKHKYPHWRPGQSLFYDGDYNPEGGALVFDRGMFFGSAYAWWFEERYNANPAGNNADTLLYGAQLGAKFALFGGETRVAAHYYDLGGGQFSNPFYNNNSNGNTTITQGSGASAVQVLAYDYDVIMGSAEVNMLAGALPLQFWVDYALNTEADDNDTAYALGVVLGKASNAKTWEAGLFYQSLDKDALFAQLIDSDFGDGRSDSEGWVLKGGYAPVRNVTLNATYFINTLNKDVAPVRGPGYSIGDELDYNRLQVDFNYKF